MSGTVEVSAGTRWSAASWLFDWVLMSTASMTSDPKLATQLSEIVEENLGWVSLSDLASAQRDEFRRVVSGDLLMKAHGDLPADLTERAVVLELIGALARAVSMPVD